MQEDSTHNISINIVKADGVIQTSPALLDGEILNITYNEYIPMLNGETKEFVPTCVVSLTCDGRFVSENIAVSILESMKKYVEQPASLML